MEFADLIKVPRVESVTLHRYHMAPVEGTLCITGHHLILSSRLMAKEELWVSIWMILLESRNVSWLV